MGLETDLRIWTLPTIILLNLGFAYLIFRLRFKAEDMPLTNSQRWGLSIIGCLYITNGTLLLIHLLRIWGAPYVGEGLMSYVTLVDPLLNVLSFLFLLSFGLIYPRPFTRWSRLKWIIIGLGALWVLLLIISAQVPYTAEPIILGAYRPVNDLVYVLAIFIPLFLWVPEYDKQQGPQITMIMSLLIWGYLFDPVTGSTSFITEGLFKGPSINTRLVQIIIVAVIFILLARIIIIRRNRWSQADKFNIFMMAISLSIGVGIGLIRTVTDPEQPFLLSPLYVLLYLMTMLSWTTLRPILFAYGLLRYQSFGPRIRADRDVTIFTSVILIFSSMLFSGLLFYNLGLLPGILGGIVAGAALAYPLYMLSKKAITRILPLSQGYEGVPLRERRTTYLMGLKTAVVDGLVEDDYDKEALEQLRIDLNISEREHDLLLSGFAKEKPQTSEGEVLEAYLFFKDGTLLGFSSKDSNMDIGSKGKVGDVLTTVGSFFKDAVESQSDLVDSIEYGNNTLIVEVERSLGLVVMLKGKDSPSARQFMRDILRTLNDEHWEDVKQVLAKGVENSSSKDNIKSILDVLVYDGGS